MTQGSGEREATEGRSEGRERWSVQQKAKVVLRLLRWEDLVEVSREVRVPPPQLEEWRRVFLEAGNRGSGDGGGLRAGAAANPGERSICASPPSQQGRQKPLH
jgi:transposase-like protein